MCNSVSKLPLQVSNDIWIFCASSQFLIFGTKSWATSSMTSPKSKCRVVSFIKNEPCMSYKNITLLPWKQLMYVVPLA